MEEKKERKVKHYHCWGCHKEIVLYEGQDTCDRCGSQKLTERKVSYVGLKAKRER